MTEPLAYATGKIYKIVNINDAAEFYIGSTKNELRVRWQQHRADAKKEHNQERMLYKRMNAIGYESFKIVLVELFPCASKQELNRREDYWISELKPKLNHMNAFRTEEQRKEYKRQWGATDKAKEGKRQYYEEHKEQLSEYLRNWSAENIESIKARYKITKTCEYCGACVGQYKMKRHQESKYCQEFRNPEIIFED